MPQKINRKVLLVGGIAVLVVGLLVVVGGVVAVILLNNARVSVSPSPVAVMPDESAPPVEPEPEAEGSERILYIEEGNVWVMNHDGSAKRQITSDAGSTAGSTAGSEVNYQSIAWARPGVASYSRCQGPCQIITYNLEVPAAEAVVGYAGTGISEQFQIGAHGWDEVADEPTVVYLVLSKDQSLLGDRVMSWSASRGAQTLYTYASRGGRGVGISDELSVKFSPNASYVSVLSTYAVGEDERLLVFGTDGWTITNRLGTEYLGHAFVSDSLMVVNRDSTIPTVVKGLYNYALGETAAPVFYASGNVIPRYVFSGRVTGNYFDASGNVVLAEINLTSRELAFPGEELLRAEIIGAGRTFIGQQAEESEFGSFVQGIYRFELTADGPVTRELSETATTYAIER